MTIDEKRPTSRSVFSNEGEFHRTSDFLEDVSSRTASQPVENKSQPDFPVITPLNFTIKGVKMSTKKSGYHQATDRDVRRLNLFAPSLQDTATWYLNELANSNIIYVFQNEKGNQETLTVTFEEKNFAHLAGLSPHGISMKQALHDWVSGKGDYDNLLVSDSLKDKMMVLPYLKELTSSNSFVFRDLSEVEKLHRIDLSKAITTEDEELLLALRDVEGMTIPASVMRIKGKLLVELQDKATAILGVYRERDGQIEQLSINKDYILDEGKALKSMLEQEISQIDSMIENFRQPHIYRDSDLDGVPDIVEHVNGTNPFSSDTDGDGLNDLVEQNSSSNAREVDKETRSIFDEIAAATKEAGNSSNYNHNQTKQTEQEID